MNKLLVLFFLALSSIAIAIDDKVLVIDNDNDINISISDFVYYFEDTTKNISIRNVIIKDSEINFTQNKKANINFGLTKSAYWLKFTVINKTTTSKNILFNIEYPLLKYLHFYSIQDTKLEKEIITGEYEKFNSREINHREFLFDLKLKPNKQYTYYVRAFSDGATMRLPMKLLSYKNKIIIDNKKNIVIGFFIGLFALAVLFNLFLFFVGKDKVNLFNALYIFFLSLFFINVEGISYQFLWTNNVWIEMHTTAIFAALSNVFLLLFTREFFKFKVHFKKINIVSWILLSFNSFVALLGFFDNKILVFALLLANIASFITIIFLLLVSIIGVVKKNNLAFYFLLSFSFFIVGVSLYISRNMGLLDNNIFAAYGILMGFTAEIIFFIFAVVHRFRIREKETSKYLEIEVALRTKNILSQKEELESQKEELETQKDQITEQHTEVLKQKDEIELKNTEIKDSIQYARLIQTSVMPPLDVVKKILPEHFVLNLPKETLSGDFYWISEKNNKIYIAVADSTGHGVLGAMMSMLGISSLNEIINKKDNITPAEILDELSIRIKNSLHQTGKIGESKDGMDISICMIDSLTNNLLFAGSNNPVYVVRQNSFNVKEDNKIFKIHDFGKVKLLEVKADKISIGFNLHKEVKFKNKKIYIENNDMFYLFTDGYADQFGGEKGKKLKYDSFRTSLAANSQNTLNKQLSILNDNFVNWKNNLEQVDDILVFGFKVNVKCNRQ